MKWCPVNLVPQSRENARLTSPNILILPDLASPVPGNGYFVPGVHYLAHETAPQRDVILHLTQQELASNPKDMNKYQLVRPRGYELTNLALLDLAVSVRLLHLG